MIKMRLIMLFLTIAVVGIFGYFFALYARGYRFDSKTVGIVPNGILVVKSDPEAAQIFLNGSLKGATNTTLSLAPGTYQLEVKKDGYLTWSKSVVIDKEVVREEDVQLFKNSAALTAITFSGATNPISSPDSSKMIYGVPKPLDISQDDKSGLWLLETLNLPLGFSRDPRRITNINPLDTIWNWLPDNKDVLVSTKLENFIVDTGQYTPETQLVSANTRLIALKEEWQIESNQKLATQVRKLPEPIASVLSANTSQVSFAPDQNMVAYTASSSAIIPEKLVTPLPGSSTQKEERSIKTNHTYVYDIKEDRNFLIDDGSNGVVRLHGFWNLPESTTTATVSKTATKKPEPIKEKRLAWFSTSRHLVVAEEGKISVVDYDNTNRQVVYSGSYVAPFAFPTLSHDRLIILTNLGATDSPANLYSLSIK